VWRFDFGDLSIRVGTRARCKQAVLVGFRVTGKGTPGKYLFWAGRIIIQKIQVYDTRTIPA
jgi:hypothetical protein